MKSTAVVRTSGPFRKWRWPGISSWYGSRAAGGAGRRGSETPAW